MPAESRRALVTGARGLAGRTLTEHLTAAGYAVFGTSRAGGLPEPRATPGLYRWRAEDPEETRALVDAVRPDLVFHLSGLARTFGPSLEEYRAANVAPTELLLRALAGLGAAPQAVILASSAAVYAPPTDETPLTETAPLDPGGAYGRSKLEMEERAAPFARELPIALARFFNFTGPGQSEDFVAARIVGKIARGAPTLSLGATDRIREFNDADAVAASLIELAVSGLTGPVNIASGRGLSIDDLIAETAGIVGRDISVERDPARMRANDPKIILGDPARLAACGAALDQPPIRETLARMLASAAPRG